jgi:hypothetical protein
MSPDKRAFRHLAPVSGIFLKCLPAKCGVMAVSTLPNSCQAPFTRKPAPILNDRVAYELSPNRYT